MIFEHNDILVLGDSFCQYRESSSDWPFIVSQKLSNSSEKPRGQGYGGASWWSVRNRLLKELEISVPKVLILCHTEPNRLPNDHDFGINSSSCLEGKIRLSNNRYIDIQKEKKIATAGKLYYEELWSDSYSRWTQLSWFKELDELLGVWGTPYVIHLRCFMTTVDYTFKNGITIKENLFSISSEGSTFRNHFTKELNQKFGNRLVEMVLNYQQGLQELAL